MPLVVQRSSVSELPTTIRLDESLAMIPGTKLNQLEALELVARVTKSGEVTAVSGDFETVLGPLKLQAGETFIDLEIDRQIP